MCGAGYNSVLVTLSSIVLPPWLYSSAQRPSVGKLFVYSARYFFFLWQTFSTLAPKHSSSSIQIWQKSYTLAPVVITRMFFADIVGPNTLPSDTSVGCCDGYVGCGCGNRTGSAAPGWLACGLVGFHFTFHIELCPSLLSYTSSQDVTLIIDWRFSLSWFRFIYLVVFRT